MSVISVLHGCVRKTKLINQMLLQKQEYKSLTFLPNIYFNNIIWWWHSVNWIDKLQMI
jgi:hypothetical protein